MTKWDRFEQSAEFRRLTACLPKELVANDYWPGMMAPVVLMDDVLWLSMELEQEQTLQAMFDEWLVNPSTSNWYYQLEEMGWYISSTSDSDFEKAKKASKGIMALQSLKVAQLRANLQDVTRHRTSVRPESLLIAEYQTYPFGAVGGAKDNRFVPQNPQQVYAMYRIRLVYAQSRFEEADDSMDILAWEEFIRRIELGHEIFTTLIGSEKPS
ncbi:MAG: hypothetical protein OEX81_01585 [Candidatus Pacebacteria bacterium]|nr:hypothetical protein [Candidatus Paceibacterota bacterium]